MKLSVYTDSGHGWLKVPRSLINKLGIADKISHYSYQRKDSVYLEEDCDASLFVLTAAKANLKLSFKEYYTYKQSKIRSYERYTK